MDETTSRATATGSTAPAPVDPRIQQRESSVKETIESILIAFILAFIFRAFVVEAFVIPTGSMATTLLGAHMRMRCPDCGYSFDVNYNARSGPGDDLTIPTRAGPEIVRERFMNQERVRLVDKVYEVRCPNCAFWIPKDQRTNPEVRYGDRILVLKYLYLFQEPRRWDVVVFKSPDDPKYEQNYIKRLIGNPGESILILDGDIYVGKGNDTSTFAIQTKPRYVQNALWRNIYDNDYYPLGLTRKDQWEMNKIEPFKQPWTVSDGAGWDGPTKPDAPEPAGQRRNFTFDNLQGSGTIRFDPAANPTQAFYDYLVYDIDGPSIPPQPVGDLRLKFFYERQAGDGKLKLRISKGEDVFIAEIEPTKARLVHERGKEQSVIGEAALRPGKSPLEVEFSNHDYRVELRIGGSEVLATTPQQYHPDVKRLLTDYEIGRPRMLPTVLLSAENQRSGISHLSLARDIYYISSKRRQGDGLPFAGTPGNIMHLGKDEYFVLGDNSLISGDARYWTKPIELPWDELEVDAGRVPGRFMLGKAFFVYWPAGFRPFPGAPPIAPDFGDMRFIR